MSPTKHYWYPPFWFQLGLDDRAAKSELHHWNRTSGGGSGHDQTIFTAWSLLAGGRKNTDGLQELAKEKETTGATLSKGLPPIPYKLVNRILRGEFVDIHKLIPETWWVTDPDLEIPENRLQSGNKWWVLDIRVWVQCFTCYISVMATKYPQQIPELLVYLIEIVRVSK